MSADRLTNEIEKNNKTDIKTGRQQRDNRKKDNKKINSHKDKQTDIEKDKYKDRQT